MRTRFASLGLAPSSLLPAACRGAGPDPSERAAEVISRNTDETRSTQSLAFSLDLLGGYDSNDSEEFQIVNPDAPPVFLESSSSATVNAGLAYSRVDRTRVLGVTVNGGTSYYGGGTIQDTGPSRNFNGALTWTTPSAARPASRRRSASSTIRSIRSAPSSRSRTTSRPASCRARRHRVSRRSTPSRRTPNSASSSGWDAANSLNGSATYSRRNYTGGEATGDTSSTSGNVGWSRQLQRTTSLNVTYGYSNGEYAPLVGGGTNRPLVGHAIQGGMSFSKRLSPRKAAQFSFTFGATRTDAVTGDAEVSYAFWAPSGSGQVRVDIGRSWALSGNYSRASRRSPA